MGAKVRRSRVRIRRAYDPPASDDGHRILVDRVWPRGRTREQLMLADWLPDVGPSHALRRWFGHEPARWEEFRRRYREELRGSAPLDVLRAWLRRGPVTLVYGARDERHNQAAALRDLLLRRR